VITTNLSTRPFYNQAAVQFWLLIVAFVAVLATIFNVSRIVYYSRSDTELATQANGDEARSAELRASAARLRSSVDAKQIETASSQAREANELIDRRTFSWTELFNRFERTLPDDLRITAVRPRIDRDRGFVLSITVISQNGNVEAVNQFMENLGMTGAFTAILSKDDHFNDAGQLQALLEAVYHPEGGRQDPGRETAPPPSSGAQSSRGTE